MLEMIALLGIDLFKALEPLLASAIAKVIAGKSALDALDEERIAEVVPAESKLAYEMAVDAARRGLPPDDDSAPSAPSAR